MTEDRDRPDLETELETDVERIHRPLFREPADPREGREPPPWWLWATVAGALFWGGWYLGRFGGSFDVSTQLAYAGLREEVVEQAAEAAAADPIERGQSLYTRHCQSCHQASGEGVPGAFPPVIESEWVTGSPEVLIRILLHGLQGPIEVAGEPYSGLMPAWGTSLDDAEIAAVATYIRQWQGNQAGPVDAGQVRAVREATGDRAEPWTAEELQAAPAGAGS